MTESDLIAALEDAGVHVVFLPWPLPGAYWHAQRLIIVDARLSPTWQRCTLAHEAVHAWYGHDGPCEPAREAWVDEHAAGLLVSEAEYRLAERIHGTNIHGIADELDVTDWIVEAFQRTLRRVA
ncbi:ImmA/IrrE family metallo-endopeptidase [Flaviflexus massiliensis]|uniref:ImmA/IrrE family metallo-endopeptidase n=1 Tax=Flaviflexus massiliensis TaxID=1522309 RepID=UPI0006D5491F|nr:ImmA/IrrE family metallo-endopeptidase [Flaviflexus massiliensis]